MSSSSDREDLVDTAEPHSLLFCRGTRHFRCLLGICALDDGGEPELYPAALTALAARGRHAAWHGPRVGM